MSEEAKVSHSIDEVKRIIGRKADLYDAAVRNGWYLPKYKSTMITEDYLMGVITGKVYCPKYSDIRLIPCPCPPEKEVLLRDFSRLMQSHNRTAYGIDDVHQPDKSWMLAILGTYNPKLAYFDKGYVPPPKATSMAYTAKVELPAHFLEGLPESKRKVKARHLKMYSNSKHEGKLQRYKVLKERFAKEYMKELNKGQQSKHRQSRGSTLGSRSHQVPPSSLNS